MDLSQEKIVFKAEKRGARWFIYLIITVGFIVWGQVIMDLFFDPQASYHSQQEFFWSCVALVCFAVLFAASKATIVRQLYITETGMILRQGISGKWSRINFDRMAAAVVSTVTVHAGTRHPQREYRELTIICRNHREMTIPTIYSDESIGRVAVILANNNIPVYQSIQKARHEATLAGYATKKPAPAEQLNDPFHVHLHYAIAWLPLFVAVCLWVGSVVNSQYGTQKDIVTYGRVISVFSTGKIILRSGQTTERFPVSSQLVCHLRIGDRVKVHYTQGCFGLGYDLDCTKLGKRN